MKVFGSHGRRYDLEDSLKLFELIPGREGGKTIFDIQWKTLHGFP